MNMKKLYNFLSETVYSIMTDKITNEKVNDNEYSQLFDKYVQEYNELMEFVYDNEEIRSKLISLNNYNHQLRFFVEEYYYKIGFENCLEIVLKEKNPFL